MSLKFYSTRGTCEVTPSQAVLDGIAKNGGLYIPKQFSPFTQTQLKSFLKMSYRQIAAEVLHKFFNDFSKKEIEECVKTAYNDNFEQQNPAPLVSPNDNLNFLELWHGPTCAFKDIALQFLPSLLTHSAKKHDPNRTLVILVATSGDTGKAALEGFANISGTKIIVFYPQDGVSKMQKRQMITQKGNNVYVAGIKGNFDDAQSGVKAIFGDKKMQLMLTKHNMSFSSANSINFGRLAPQIVYYITAWCDLIRLEKIKFGESFNVTVPTGNFGDILAGYYAKLLGIPIAKFICASNKNRILTDFIQTGIYDKNRTFYTTCSPSMDILISSNLERLLYLLYNENSNQVAELMKQLKEKGRYEISKEALAKLQEIFYGGSCDEARTKATIANTFKKYHYLCDPHTAVAVHVYNQYRMKTHDKRTNVILSTASPYKFPETVLSSIAPGKTIKNEFVMLNHIEKITKMEIPQPLRHLNESKVLHCSRIEVKNMKRFIVKSLFQDCSKIEKS